MKKRKEEEGRKDQKEQRYGICMELYGLLWFCIDFGWIPMEISCSNSRV